MANLKYAAVAIVFASASLLAATKPRQTGSICVAQLPSDAKKLDHDYPGGKAPREYKYDFTVQVDNGERVAVPRKSGPIRIGDISAAGKHRVRIRDGQKVIESFSFTFPQRKSNDLCLVYGPWYQTWSLEPAGTRKACKCP